MKPTLKDLFAIHAMQGILENGTDRNGCPIDPDILAEQAYEIAFAMWKKREELTLKHSFNDSAIDIDIEALVSKREL